ncbi:unnamed protein product [Rhizophagus irregularis]|nr:unnamed protein product [Rhizophagus irregularis]
MIQCQPPEEMFNMSSGKNARNLSKQRIIGIMDVFLQSISSRLSGQQERPIQQLVKHSMGLPKTSSNSILFYERNVGLFCLWQYIATNNIMEFIKALNKRNTASETIMIRLRQGQIDARCPSSIFSSIHKYRDVFKIIANHN